jgi:Zn ribbon nucleic-acid-binding protein
MNNDMKCPICGTILDKAFINDKIRGCPKCRNMGNIELWQELIHTRKALDKAKWWLKEIVESHRCTPISTAEMALKEITALEQKDRK